MIRAMRMPRAVAVTHHRAAAGTLDAETAELLAGAAKAGLSDHDLAPLRAAVAGLSG